MQAKMAAISVPVRALGTGWHRGEGYLEELTQRGPFPDEQVADELGRDGRALEHVAGFAPISVELRAELGPCLGEHAAPDGAATLRPPPSPLAASPLRKRAVTPLLPLPDA
jgi:hypothetical protein